MFRSGPHSSRPGRAARTTGPSFPAHLLAAVTATATRTARIPAAARPLAAACALFAAVVLLPLPAVGASDADDVNASVANASVADASVADAAKPDAATPDTVTVAAAPAASVVPSPLDVPNGFYHPFNWMLHSGADELRAQGRQDDAAVLDRLAAQQVSRWLTGHWSDAASLGMLFNGGWMDTGSVASDQMPVLVLYNLPHRDCGGYSAGSATPDSYRQWIDFVSATIGTNRVAVVLEPDALSVADFCLDAAQHAERWALIRYATETLKARNVNAVTYIAAMTDYRDPPLMAQRLVASGIANTRGFALNVADFQSTATNLAYGEQLRALLGTDAKYVIDTSRNGSGPYAATGEAAWCNPPGRTIGERPTARTGVPNVDAYLWIKDQVADPGCWNSNPVASPAEYSLDMARRSGI